jgi:hypothetical protein
MRSVTDDDYARTLEELERLLNDPAVPMQPELICSLLDKVSEWGAAGGVTLSRRLAASPQAPTTES